MFVSLLACPCICLFVCLLVHLLMFFVGSVLFVSLFVFGSFVGLIGWVGRIGCLVGVVVWGGWLGLVDWWLVVGGWLVGCMVGWLVG